MKTIVHIGAHRTGTTSIQNALVHNEDQLLDAGITAITASNAREILFDPLQKYAENTGDEKQAYKETLDVVFAEIQKESQGSTSIIYSEENLIGDMDAVFEGQQLGNQSIANLKALTEFIEPNFDIVISVREYASYYNSVFTYRFCKSLFHVFDHYKATLLNENLGWHNLILEIHKHFPNNKIKVVPFETYNHDFSNYFPHLGIPNKIEIETAHKNRTRSSLAIRRLEKNLALGTPLNAVSVKKIVQRAHKRSYTHYNPWSAEERALLEARYAAHKELIKTIKNVTLA